VGDKEEDCTSWSERTGGVADTEDCKSKSVK
jgi:hypothetical protein